MNNINFCQIMITLAAADREKRDVAAVYPAGAQTVSHGNAVYPAGHAAFSGFGPTNTSYKPVRAEDYFVTIKHPAES